MKPTGEQNAKCRTTKELLDLLAEAGVELPDEALDTVSGGNGKPKGDEPIAEWTCPYCEQSITLYRPEDAAKHVTKCPKGPFA